MAPTLDRRGVLASGLAFAGTAARAYASPGGDRLAAAARRQIGVTTGYDPAYLKLAYPGGDPPRSTGVCADVIVRAARDGLDLDLQRLVHDDMARAFAAYPSRRAWGLTRPDANIDHRRVLNLETFWTRAGARLWKAPGARSGADFEVALQPGDFLTWLVAGNLPHVGVVASASRDATLVHNIGGGTLEIPLRQMTPHRAVAHYRWPRP